MTESRLILNKQFDEQLPCNGCKLSSICRYYNSLSRPSFNPKVFDVKVTCKIKDKTLDDIIKSSQDSIPIGVE